MHQISLLLLLFFCHFVADYTPLSTPWMSKAKEFGTPRFPILCHAGVHALLMGIVLAIWAYNGWIFPSLILKLVCFELITHFMIDRGKGKINRHFPIVQNPNSNEYRILFGLDQYLHAVVIILIVYQCGGNF